VFEFAHGHGLAVVLVGQSVPKELRAFAELDDREVTAVRALFAALGAGVRRAGETQHAGATAAHLQEENARLQTALDERERLFEERLSRVEALTDALVQSRVLRLARGLRRVS
jgi:hypothetical protein